MKPTLLRPVPAPWPDVRPTRRAERRRLAAQDRISARLAELETIGALLVCAAARVHTGWCQDTWTSPEAGVCLVAAIRASDVGGASQAVDRAVDVAWHTLHHDPVGVRWTPAPSVRLTRVRDLARWNDHHSRTRPEVVGLLSEARDLARRERVRLTP